MNSRIEDIDPKNTQEFVQYIEETSNESYVVEVQFWEDIIVLEVDPTVFPPKSEYSVSSKSLLWLIENMEWKAVAEIWVWTWIESIVALKRWAESVDAWDINENAVKCARKNMDNNKVWDRANVFYSDLFENFPEDKSYDLIIANLPIVNYNPNNWIEWAIDTAKQKIFDALYDEDFKLHKRLFEEAKYKLSENWEIIFTHANLQSQDTSTPDYDFDELEKLIEQYWYYIDKVEEYEDIWCKWRSYSIKLIN